MAEGDASAADRAELATRAERLDARREALGKVNPLAREEYEEEKGRLEELATQRQDLEASLTEIAKLRDELAETVQRRFDETFERVARNFEEVSATLFPGGEGRLRLVEVDEEGDGGEAAEGGIEIGLRPAGKKITRLTLLSGGEALGDLVPVALLASRARSTFSTRFEAALDDSNVGALRRVAPASRRGAVHRDRTEAPMGGHVLYGVVRRRLPGLVSRRSTSTCRRIRVPVAVCRGRACHAI